MKLGKRFLALLLALTMIVSNLPVSVLAEEFTELTAENTGEISVETPEVPAESEEETEAPAQEPAQESTQAPAQETSSPETTAAVETEAPEETEETEQTEAPEQEPEDSEDFEEDMEPGEEVAAEEDAMDNGDLSGEYAPYLTHGWLGEDDNGYFYEDTDGSNQNDSYLLRPGYVHGHIYYLNTWNGSDWDQTPVEVQVKGGSMNLDKVPADRIRSGETYGDYFYLVSTDTWNQNLTVYVEDGDQEIGLPVDTSLGEFSIHTSPARSIDDFVHEYKVEDLEEEHTFYVRFESSYWNLLSWELADPSVGQLIDTDEDGVNDALTLSQEFLESLQDGGRRFEVNWNVQAFDDESKKETLSDGVSCSYESTQTFLTFGYLSWNEHGQVYETGEADGNDGYLVRPGEERYQIYYLNTWNAETEQFDRQAVEIWPGEGLQAAKVSENQIAPGERNGQYFYKITADAWNKETYVAAADGTRFTVYTDLGESSIHTDPSCSEENFVRDYSVDFSGGENVLYFRFESNDWELVSVEPHDPNAADVADSDGDGVYEITLREGFVNSIDKHNSQSVDLDITVQGIAEYNQGEVHTWSEGVECRYTDPHLTFAWLDWDNGKCYQAHPADQDNLTIAPGNDAFVIFYVNVWDPQTKSFDLQPTTIRSEGDIGLITCGNEAADYAEHSEYYYRIIALDWGGGTVYCDYMDANGELEMEMPVYCGLGNSSFHSSAEGTTEDYISEHLIRSAEENVFYFRFQDEYWELERLWAYDGAASVEPVEGSDNMYRLVLKSWVVEEASRNGQRHLELGLDVRERNGEGRTETWRAGINCRSVMPYLTVGWLDNWGEGWFEPDYGEEGGPDSPDSRDFVIRPGDEMWQIFYLNVWDGEFLMSWPVNELYSDGPVCLEYISDLPDQQIREGEENGYCFYRITSNGWGDECGIYCEYDGQTVRMPVYTGLGEDSFHSSEACNTEDYLNTWPLDPFGENVAYFRFQSDYWQLDEETFTAMRNGENGPPLADIEPLGGGIYKITLTDEFVSMVLSENQDMVLFGQVYAQDDSTEPREFRIHCWADTNDAKAVIYQDGVDYFFFGEDEILRSYENEDGQYITEKTDSMGEGVSYSLAENKLTLNNATMSTLHLTYEWYDESSGMGGKNLPNENLTIELIGENTIINDNILPVGINDGINLTFIGEGSLYVKAINTEGRFDSTGWAYCYPAWFMGTGKLTLQDSVSITVEQSGRGLESIYDDQGQYIIGYRPAHLNAMNLMDVDLILKDSATLTTVVPQGAMASGENRDEYNEFPGGYNGIAHLKTVTVTNSAVLNTSSLHVSGGYYQFGGKVNIQGLRGKFYDVERDFEGYHTNGLEVGDGAQIKVTGGELNISINTPETPDLDRSYFYGIVTRGGRLDITGGEVNITGVNGTAIQIENLYIWDEETGEEYSVFSTVNISGGTINAGGVGDEVERDKIISTNFIDLAPGSTAKITGGEINTEWSNLWLGGNVVFDGAELNGYGTILYADGEFKMKSGTITLDSGAWINNGMTYMTGGTLDLPGSFMVVPTGFTFENGTINIDYHGQNPNDLEARPPALDISGYFQVGPEYPEEGYEAKLNILNNTASHSIYVGCNEDEEGNRHGGTLYINENGTVTVDSTLPNDLRVPGEWYISVLGTWEASLVVDGGTLSIDAENIDCAMDMGTYLQAGGDVDIKAWGGSGENLGMAVKNVFELAFGDLDVTGYNGMSLGFNQQESREDAYLAMMSGTLTVNAVYTAIHVEAPMEIHGGDLNIYISGVLQEDAHYGTGIYVSSRDEVVEDEIYNYRGSLHILGGNITIEMAETPVGCTSQGTGIAAIDSDVYIEGGNIEIMNTDGLFSRSTDPEVGLHLAEGIVTYSRTGNTKLTLLDYVVNNANGTFYIKAYEEDNDRGDLMTGAGVEFALNTVTLSSSCGVNTTWELEKDTLKILGAGTITDYSERYAAPWTAFADDITKVEIAAGVTYIGTNVFGGLKNLKQITFQGSAPRMAENAFEYVTATVFYPAADDSWNDVAYQDYGGQLTWLVDSNSVYVVNVEKDINYLLPSKKANLTAEFSSAEGEDMTLQWTLDPECKSYATLTVKNGVATVTGKNVTEKKTITVYASLEESAAAPYPVELTLYPKATSVSIFQGGEEVTGDTLPIMYAEGLRVELGAKLNPDNGLAEEQNVSPIVTWTTSNAKIAEVDEHGVVTFKSFGNVTITAKAQDGSNRSAKVTIAPYDRYYGSLTATFDITSLQLGRSAQMTVKAGDVEIPMNELELKVVSGGKYVELETMLEGEETVTTGFVTAIAASGSVTVQASLKDDLQKRTVRAALKTIPVAPTDITLSTQKYGEHIDGYTSVDGFAEKNDGLELYVTTANKKQTFNLTAMGVHPDGGDLPVKGQIKWSSGNSRIATVREGSDGTVTITVTGTAGTCIIKGESKLDPTVYTEIEVYANNFAPAIDKKTITMDTMKEDSEIIGVTFHEANPVRNVALLTYDKTARDYVSAEEYFDAEYADGEVSIRSVGMAQNGSLKARLVLTTEHGETELDFTIKVSNTTPKYTVKQTRKLNDKELTGLITVKSTTASIEGVLLEDCDYTLEKTNNADEYEVILRDGVEYADDLEGTLEIKMAGYYPAKYSIKLGANSKSYSLSLNTYLEAPTASVAVALEEGTTVHDIYVLDTDTKTEELSEDFDVTYADGKFTVAYTDVADEVGMTGSVKAQVRVSSADGKTGFVSLNIKAANKAPTLTVKTVKKLNLSDDPNYSYALLGVTAKQGEVMDIELDEAFTYYQDGQDESGNYYIIPLEAEKMVSRGTVKVAVDGYRGMYEKKNVSIGTEKIADKAVLGATSLTLYSSITDMTASTTLESYWAGSDIIDVEIKAPNNCPVDLIYGNGQLTAEFLDKEAVQRATNYKFTITASTEAGALKAVTLTVKVTKNPAAKLKTSSAKLKISQPETVLEIPVTVPVNEGYTVRFTEIDEDNYVGARYVDLSYNAESGNLEVALKDGAEAGRYSVKLTPVFVGDNSGTTYTQSKLTLTVTVSK